jgi:hypothetical protein
MEKNEGLVFLWGEKGQTIYCLCVVCEYILNKFLYAKKGREGKIIIIIIKIRKKKREREKFMLGRVGKGDNEGKGGKKSSFCSNDQFYFCP